MGLHETYRSKEFREDITELRSQEWTDFDDFWAKYGEETNPDAWTTWMSVAAFFNGVGVLLKRNLIDIILVEDLLSNVVFGSWSRMKCHSLGTESGRPAVYLVRTYFMASNTSTNN